MGLQYPTYNGKALDFAAIELSFSREGNARIFTAFENISYDQSIEEAALYGTWAAPLGRTRGRLKMGEGNLKWSSIAEGQEFIDLLGDGYLEKEFIITHNLGYPGYVGTITHVLHSCRLLDVKDDFSGGAEPLGEEMPFSYLLHTRNGKSPLVSLK